MADTVRLYVLSPEQTLLELESVGWVRVRLANGERISIHPHHAPLAAETADEELEYAQAGATHRVPLGPALLRVQNDEVVLFAGTGASEAESQTAAQALPRLVRAVAGQVRSSVPRERRRDSGEGGRP